MRSVGIPSGRCFADAQHDSETGAAVQALYYAQYDHKSKDGAFLLDMTVKSVDKRRYKVYNQTEFNRLGCLRVIAMAEIIPVEPDKVMLDWGMSFLAFRPFMRYSCRGVFYLLPR